MSRRDLRCYALLVYEVHLENYVHLMQYVLPLPHVVHPVAVHTPPVCGAAYVLVGISRVCSSCILCRTSVRSDFVISVLDTQVSYVCLVYFLLVSHPARLQVLCVCVHTSSPEWYGRSLSFPRTCACYFRIFASVVQLPLQLYAYIRRFFVGRFELDCFY